MPTLTIFAGVNGCGKSTLNKFFKDLKTEKQLGKKINSDEILKSFNGNWQDVADICNAGKITIKKIEECLNNKESFNWETTIFTRYTLKILKLAKSLGYVINLYFVNVNNKNILLQRINNRVLNGGHGISEDILNIRFNNKFQFIKQCLPYINNALFLDNTTKFKLALTYNQNKVLYTNTDISWANELLSEITGKTSPNKF